MGAPVSESALGARAGDLPLLQRLLAARNLTDPETIHRFCNPRLTDLHDPALMPGLVAAAQRLATALRERQVIAIYGDYDVDGVTGCAILYHVIKALAPECDLRLYIPHRIDEGYGLNSEAMRHLRREGADVVVSVDCGITAVEEARVAKEIGLDLIITDHHNLPIDGGELPDAFGLVHPRLPGSAYPFGELCGAGVAFKLAWGLTTEWQGSQRVGERLQRLLLDMLPLAALGTIADIVPLVDENRIIATFGLRWIKQTPIVGLQALIEASDLMDSNIDCQKVGFVLGPRLNACGRMGHAAEAAEMLTSADAVTAREIAERLTKLNRQRQQTERRIFDQAAQMAIDAGMTEESRRAIVLAHESWHPGVVGIVCSRLVERFGRPAILLQQQGDLCKGSARSVDGYSIHAGLAATASHLQTFGGHDAAAGLTIETAKLPEFTMALIEHANARIAPDQLMPAIGIDCDATLAELQIDTVRKLAEISPFGRDNPRPALRLQNATIAETPRQIGANGRHLSMKMRQDTDDGRNWTRAVWWSAGSRASDLAAGMNVDVIIEPKINTWNGRTTVEAEIKDLLIREP